MRTEHKQRTDKYSNRPSPQEEGTEFALHKIQEFLERVISDTESLRICLDCARLVYPRVPRKESIDVFLKAIKEQLIIELKAIEKANASTEDTAVRNQIEAYKTAINSL